MVVIYCNTFKKKQDILCVWLLMRSFCMLNSLWKQYFFLRTLSDWCFLNTFSRVFFSARFTKLQERLDGEAGRAKPGTLWTVNLPSYVKRNNHRVPMDPWNPWEFENLRKRNQGLEKDWKEIDIGYWKCLDLYIFSRPKWNLPYKIFKINYVLLKSCPLKEMNMKI